jgi:hypothetical protein
VLLDAVAAANLPTLLLVIVQLTGDSSVLRGALRPQRASPQKPDGGIGAADAEWIRRRAVTVLRDPPDC